MTVPLTTLLGGYFCAAVVQGLSSRSRYARLILPVVGIDLLDPHLDRLPLLQHVAGMLHAGPGHLADVYQAVDAAAQIDKGPEIHQLPHHALENLARLQRTEHLLPGLLLLAFQHGAAAEDQVPPLGIGLDNHARQPLIDVRGEVFHPVQRHLADGNEAADVVHFAFQPARVVAGHADLDQRPFDQIGPIVDLHRLVRQRQLVESVFGIQPLHDHLNHGAGPRRHVELPQRDNALLAAGELHEHVVAPHGHHAAALDRVGLERLFLRLASAAEQLVHRRIAHRPAQLGVEVRWTGA